MPIRRSPNGAGHTRPQPGRNRSEQVDHSGIGGRDHSVRAITREHLPGRDAYCKDGDRTSTGNFSPQSQAVIDRTSAVRGGRLMLKLTIGGLVCGLIFGTICGAIFKVYILGLAMGIGLCLIIVAGVALQAGWWSIVIAAVVTATAIQLGYGVAAAIFGFIRQRRGNGEGNREIAAS
jgi:hypothetical protein